MTGTLYEINSSIISILQYLDYGAGEVTDDMLAALTGLELDRSAKIDNICRFIRSRVSRAAGIQAELDRLQAAKRTEENIVDRLKMYVKDSLSATGETKIETELFKVWIQKNSAAAVTLDGGITLDSLPQWAKKAVVEVSLDRDAILQWAAAGMTLPNGVKVETGTHLRIK